MRKVLHIITRLDMGGSAQNTLSTCQQLSRKYRILLAHGLSVESGMTDAERVAVDNGIRSASKNGIDAILVPSLVRRIHPFKDIRALFALLRIIRKETPDIVHTHTSKAGILGRLAAKISRTPHIIHTPHGHVFYGHFDPVLSKIFLWIERRFASITDRTIALTDGERRDYLDFKVYQKDRIIKIHSGVNIQKFKSSRVNKVEKKRSVGINLTGPVIGFAGWLLPIKGPMLLLKAMDHVWSEAPDANLVFLGKGDLDFDLRSEAHKTGKNGSVSFLGWRDDVEEIMPLFDIFVLPSLNEGMGRVLVEAMAAGKPVIASNVGGIPDLVEDGNNGLLVPPGDPEMLGASIRRLIGNPAEARKMGQRGREMSDRFGVDAMIEKLDNLYTECVPG